MILIRVRTHDSDHDLNVSLSEFADLWAQHPHLISHYSILSRIHKVPQLVVKQRHLEAKKGKFREDR